MTSPLRIRVAEDPRSEQPTTHLERSYFELHRFIPEDDSPVRFSCPTESGSALFRANELVVEAFIDVQPPETATSTYDLAPLKCARRWPAEILWKASRPTGAAENLEAALNLGGRGPRPISPRSSADCDLC
jgi:hypothetical protein